MNAGKIEKLQKLSGEIQNFADCYRGNELWGIQDGPVPFEKLMEFLIENPHFQEIADSIKKLDGGLNP